MLLNTNLVNELSLFFSFVNKCNVFCISNPYCFTTSPNLTGRNGYKFSVSQSFQRHGKYFQLASLFIPICLQILNIVYNPVRSIFDMGIYSFYCVAFSLSITMAISHINCATDFAHFLNQISSLDTKYIVHQPENSTKFSSQLIGFACRLFSFAAIAEALAVASASAIYPCASWSFLSYIYQTFTPKSLLLDIFTRTVIFWFHYLIQKNMMNFANINIVINVLISNFSMATLLKLFKRYINFIKQMCLEKLLKFINFLQKPWKSRKP